MDDIYTYEDNPPEPRLQEREVIRIACGTCMGMGKLPLTSSLVVDCDVCNGKGEVDV